MYVIYIYVIKISFQYGIIIFIIVYVWHCMYIYVCNYIIFIAFIYIAAYNIMCNIYTK